MKTSAQKIYFFVWSKERETEKKKERAEERECREKGEREEERGDEIGII